MHFHTVLFDFDYTLADTSVGIVNSFHYAFDRLNIERKEEASIKKTIGMPLKAAFTALTGLQDRSASILALLAVSSSSLA